MCRIFWELAVMLAVEGLCWILDEPGIRSLGGYVGISWPWGLCWNLSLYAVLVTGKGQVQGLPDLERVPPCSM